MGEEVGSVEVGAEGYRGRSVHEGAADSFLVVAQADVAGAAVEAGTRRQVSSVAQLAELARLPR